MEDPRLSVPANCVCSGASGGSVAHWLQWWCLGGAAVVWRPPVSRRQVEAMDGRG